MKEFVKEHETDEQVCSYCKADSERYGAVLASGKHAMVLCEECSDGLKLHN